MKLDWWLYIVWLTDLFSLLSLARGSALLYPMQSTGVAGGATPGLSGITVDKSVEFSYEELAKASDDFSLANKIGQGGFGAVYYAELRGEVCFLLPSSFIRKGL